MFYTEDKLTLFWSVLPLNYMVYKSAFVRYSTGCILRLLYIICITSNSVHCIVCLCPHIKSTLGKKAHGYSHRISEENKLSLHAILSHKSHLFT